MQLTIRVVPLAAASLNSSNSNNSAADDGACSSAIHVDLRLGALSVLAAWRGKVSELLSKSPRCSRTSCFISLEAEYEAVAAPEPAVTASPEKTTNATAPVRRKGRDLKIDAKAGSGGLNSGDGSGDGGSEGRIAASPSSAWQESGRQGSGEAQRSEWQAWLAPFKEMQLEPVQVGGGGGGEVDKNGAETVDASERGGRGRGRGVERRYGKVRWGGGDEEEAGGPGAGGHVERRRGQWGAGQWGSGSEERARGSGYRKGADG